MPTLDRAALVDQIEATLTASKAVQIVDLKRRTRAAVRRAEAITNVEERLEAFAALVTFNPQKAARRDVRRDHAAAIVDAVNALLRRREEE